MSTRRSSPFLVFLLAAPLLALATGCGDASGGGDDKATIELQFAGMVGAEPFDCGSTYKGIGTTPTTTAVPKDFRLYVSRLELLRSNGDRVELALDQDGKWQHEDVAFLDFEDDTGLCKTGSPETRRVVSGTAPNHDDYVGVSFKLGVPDDKNHLDAATAPPPLNMPSMWWDWAGGYRWAKVEFKSDMNDPYYFHMGQTDCTGTPVTGITCDHPNQGTIEIDGLDLAKDTIAVDVAALWEQNDLDIQIDYMTDFIAGCMAFTPDDECIPMFERIGLTWLDEKPSDKQNFFRKM